MQRSVFDCLICLSFNDLQYGIFFGAGGHAAIYDYPSASSLHKVAAQIYANGGVVSAVCHGPAILPGILDTSTGKPIIAGKKVTGFAEKGEVEVCPALNAVMFIKVPCSHPQ